LKNLQIAAGIDIPKDIAPLVENLPVQGLKKTVAMALAEHKEKNRNKVIERHSIKKLGNEDVNAEVPLKMNIQFYRNEMMSSLKDQYGMPFIFSFLSIYEADSL